MIFVVRVEFSEKNPVASNFVANTQPVARRIRINDSDILVYIASTEALAEKNV